MPGLTQGSAPGPNPDAEARVHLMREGLLNYLGSFVSGVVGLLLVPILLRGLGTEPYGLWIAALSVARLAALLNFGLYWPVAREVASAPGGLDEAARFVRAAGIVYLLVGVLGAGLIGILGLPLSGGLHLSPLTRAGAPAVFGLVGLGFLASQLSAFAVAVLHGLRRFDVAALVSAATVFLRAAGIVALLAAGADVLAVAAWHAAASVVAAGAALVVVRRLEPRFGLQWKGFDWGLVRARFPFGLASQFTSAAIDVLWDGIPVLIGMTRGSASIVPYHVGQQFPMGVSAISWRNAEILFPAASGQKSAGPARTREVFEAGLRWNMLLALPLCLVLWMVAPNLLQAWLGQAPPETLAVLRLTTVAVFADAWGVAALQVLWGLGQVRTLLLILGTSTVACLGLSAWLLTGTGVVAAAWLLLLTMALRSFFLLRAASRQCEIPALRLILGGAAGLIWPGLACAALAASTTYLVPVKGWAGIIATGLGAGGAYALILYFRGGRPEERILIRQAIGRGSAFWFMLAVLLFLYLNVFILPNTPIWRGDDDSLSIVFATRMLEGQVPYRDYFSFFAPGIKVLYWALFKLLGAQAWVPNVAVIAVGGLLTWVTLVISRNVMGESAALLASLLFLTFAFRFSLYGNHRWFSMLAVAAAVAVLMRKRTPGRLALAGALCGLASFFTQPQGALAVLGFVVFLWWEQRRKKQEVGRLFRDSAWLCSAFLTVTMAANAYFVWKAGWAEFVYGTVTFLLRYWSADTSWNSLDVYMTVLPLSPRLDEVPKLFVYLFVHALLPLVYVLFFFRYRRTAAAESAASWERLMLLAITGVFQLAATVTAPAWPRLSAVALPGFVLWVWLIQNRRALVRCFWISALMLALTASWWQQTRWRAYFDSPRGRMCITTPEMHNVYSWVSQRTKPSEFLFELHHPDIYFPLALRNPTKLSFVTANDFTRPEQVKEALGDLEKHRVRFVVGKLDVAPLNAAPGSDHLGPLRAYLEERYRVVRTFGDYGQVWERKE